MIAIIDYDAGNIKSVEKALLYLGAEVCLTRDADVILGADGVILPGVGAFGDAMQKLRDYGLVEVIHKCVDKGTPFMGICLGLQLLFESSRKAPVWRDCTFWTVRSSGFRRTADSKCRISVGTI